MNYGKYSVGICLLLLKEYLEANAGKNRLVTRRQLEDYLDDKDFPIEKKTLHADFTLQNRPHPFTETQEKGCGLTFSRTKQKALKTEVFKAFGAAIQIRTGDLILTNSSQLILSC